MVKQFYLELFSCRRAQNVVVLALYRINIKFVTNGISETKTEQEGTEGVGQTAGFC